MLGLLFALAAQAAEVTNLVEAGDHRAAVGLTVEPHTVFSLGYVHGFSAWDHDVALSASLALPVHLLDGRHHRLELGARTGLAAWRSLRVLGRLGLQEQATRSALFSGVAVSVRPSLLAGTYGERAFVALEVGTPVNVATWIAPTDHYREAIWSGAPTGWYAGTGGFLVVGLQGGVTVADRVEITARAAMDTTLRGGSRTAPIDVGLGVDLWF